MRTAVNAAMFSGAPRTGAWIVAGDGRTGQVRAATPPELKLARRAFVKLECDLAHGLLERLVPRSEFPDPD
jgi:hypothetical protein